MSGVSPVARTLKHNIGWEKFEDLVAAVNNKLAEKQLIRKDLQGDYSRKMIQVVEDVGSLVSTSIADQMKKFDPEWKRNLVIWCAKDPVYAYRYASAVFDGIGEPMQNPYIVSI